MRNRLIQKRKSTQHKQFLSTEFFFILKREKGEEGYNKALEEVKWPKCQKIAK